MSARGRFAAVVVTLAVAVSACLCVTGVVAPSGPDQGALRSLVQSSAGPAEHGAMPAALRADGSSLKVAREVPPEATALLALLVLLAAAALAVSARQERLRRYATTILSAGVGATMLARAPPGAFATTS